jgi:8-oxo-dGTP pyrophosphatase MutT (NUDIX family)|tara:strand:+ start:226880 stop:227506 length:627 start_codon:yes stop_codon:yes gene_type:complete
MIELFKTYISEQFKYPLPGIKTHLEAAPYRKADVDELTKKQARQSGVLILFYEKNNILHTVLIKRAINNSNHSGQIAFPGGKKEEHDANLIETALREANEEIGIVKEHVDVIGKLTDVFIPVSNFLVAPVIGFIDYSPTFTLQISEVYDIVEVEVQTLIHPNTFQQQMVKLSGGVQLKVPCFVVNKQIVWGATALMINELRYLIKDFY